MPNLLLFAYFYPPLGGPGVQRPLKLVKYMKKAGWNVDVITVKEIVFHSFDYELCREDESRHLVRASSWDPMAIMKKVFGKKRSISQKVYFNTSEKVKGFIRNSFPIDDKIGWFPNAWKAANYLIKRNKYDAVMATIGPYTSAVLAFKISLKYNIPLVIDYRDHWTLNPYLNYSTRSLKKYAGNWEKRILEKAVLVSTIGKTMKQELSTHFGKHLESKISVMYNGFDEIDFKQEKKENKTDIVLRYIGNFYGHRTLKFFMQALGEISKRYEALDNTNIEFVGNYYSETLELIKNSNLTNVSTKQQVEHDKAVELMMSSDALLLFVASESGNGVLTGKIFEYLRSGKPVFAMIPPNGEAAAILRKFGHEFIIPMEDTAQIAEKLPVFIDLILSKKISLKDFDPIYSRECQTNLFLASLKKKL